MSQLDILYTPSDYDVKLIYQTWMHLLRTDYRYILETCADPPPLSINPLTLAKLLDLDNRPALSTRYYDNCHISARFHIVSKNTSQDSLFDRLLILSISLPEVEQPDIHPSQICAEKWPSTYYYDTDVEDGTVNRLRGSIWATHKLKALASKATPLLLETITLPTPTELLRFRQSTNEGTTWSDPQHFSIDDFGYLSTDKNASFQLDHSQQLINTRLDETLDAATGQFIPDIAILGRPVKARDANYNGPRPFANINQYPYETTESARARLYQPPWIPDSPRSPLNPQQIPRIRTSEQMQVLAQVHNGETAVQPVGGTRPSNPPVVTEPAGGTASESPQANQALNLPEDQIITQPPANETSQINNVTSDPAVQAVLEISSGSASATSTNMSSDSRPTLGVGVDPKEKSTPPKERPLAASETDEILLAPAQDSNQANISEENTRSLRSEAKAPEQHDAFWSFVHSFAEFYNQEKAEFSGSESSLHPLFTHDSATSKFIVNEDQMTIRNLSAINSLMVDMNKKNLSMFDKTNKNLKTILKKFVK